MKENRENWEKLNANEKNETLVLSIIKKIVLPKHIYFGILHSKYN